MLIGVLLAAALVPMITGFIWYNPKVLGTAWMEASGMTEEKIRAGNMPVVFGVSFVLAVILAMQMAGLSIHQNAVTSLFFGIEGFSEPGSGTEIQTVYDNFMAVMGEHHRSFKLGAIHGCIARLMFVLPVLGTNALF